MCSSAKLNSYLLTAVTDNVKKHLSLIMVLLAVLVATGTVRAQLQIEIIDGNASALPIAVVPFQWMEAGAPPVDSVDSIISADLYRSGLFKPMDVEDMA